MKFPKQAPPKRRLFWFKRNVNRPAPSLGNGAKVISRTGVSVRQLYIALFTGGSRLAGQPAKDQTVKDGYGTQTHGAVYAASGFTGGIKPRNRLVVAHVKHTAVGVGHKTAHTVVHLRDKFPDIPGTLNQRNKRLVKVTVPVRILLVADIHHAQIQETNLDSFLL